MPPIIGHGALCCEIATQSTPIAAWVSDADFEPTLDLPLAGSKGVGSMRRQARTRLSGFRTTQESGYSPVLANCEALLQAIGLRAFSTLSDMNAEVTRSQAVR